jgi:beta-glucosidase
MNAAETLPHHFPPGFLWGTATAAHQVEGSNTHCDSWALEHAAPSLFREPSGDAIDQWHRFGDDMAVLASLGLSVYRFSVEWARIEPEPGRFSQAVLDHYQRCIDACLARGITPMLTFQHFTLPLWLSRMGGWDAPDFAARFGAYCARTARALSGYTHAFTINELNLPLFIAQPLMSRWEASESGRAKLAAAQRALGAPATAFFLMAREEAILGNGVAAHRAGVAAIRAERPGVAVGATLAVQEEAAEPGAEALRDARWQAFYGRVLPGLAGDDVIGVQTYSRATVGVDGRVGPQPGHPLTIMGYEDRPQAIGQTCRDIWAATRQPILITENGWAGDDDTRRCAFIREALEGVHAAIADGVDVRGYLYWSAFDNFEWMYGYGPRFGLIGVDRATQARRIKPSALMLGEIARANAVGMVPEVTREVSGDLDAGSGAPVGA